MTDRPAYRYPYLLSVAQGPNPVRLTFASEQEAKRYRFSFYSWRRGARRRKEPTFDSVSLYQRGTVIIFATRENANLAPELLGWYPQPLEIDLPEEDDDDPIRFLDS